MSRKTYREMLDEDPILKGLLEHLPEPTPFQRLALEMLAYGNVNFEVMAWPRRAGKQMVDDAIEAAGRNGLLGHLHIHRRDEVICVGVEPACDLARPAGRGPAADLVVRNELAQGG